MQTPKRQAASRPERSGRNVSLGVGQTTVKCFGLQAFPARSISFYQEIGRQFGVPVVYFHRPPSHYTQMIYRTAAALIVVFWLVMTTLLIRNEVNPEDSRLREVPVTHVLKLLYLHEQPSHLRIYAGGTPIG